VRTPRVTGLLTLTVAVLVGCGGNKKERPVVLNTEAVERSIEHDIQAQRNLAADVSCPVNVEQKKGNAFSCFATVRGKRSEFLVKQTDSDGHVTYVGL
jgi:hypothetical protein